MRAEKDSSSCSTGGSLQYLVDSRPVPLANRSIRSQCALQRRPFFCRQGFNRGDCRVDNDFHRVVMDGKGELSGT